MQARTRLLLFLMVGAWVGFLNRPTIAASHVCDELCGSGADCDAECWLTQEDYDNGAQSTTCGDQGYSCCGDGMCDTAQEICDWIRPESCRKAFWRNAPAERGLTLPPYAA